MSEEIKVEEVKVTNNDDFNFEPINESIQGMHPCD